jgi:hypothetical protein
VTLGDEHELESFGVEQSDLSLRRDAATGVVESANVVSTVKP